MLVEFLRLALAFFGADEILQRSFQVSDGRFRAADFLLQLVDAVLHLFALDGVQALLGSFGVTLRASIPVGGRMRNVI